MIKYDGILNIFLYGIVTFLLLIIFIIFFGELKESIRRYEKELIIKNCNCEVIENEENAMLGYSGEFILKGYDK